VSESENIVVETAERMFADLADAQSIIASRSDAWKAPVWDALADAGLTLPWIDEALGGAGADLATGFALLQAAGRAALAVPLAETMIAGWLLARAGLSSPAGAMTVAPAQPNGRITLSADGTLNGRARNVPFAADARHIAVLASTADGALAIALVETAACQIAAGNTLAGDAVNGVTFDRVRPIAQAPAPAGVDLTALMLMGAAARSLQIAGALETALDITVRYANERVAFEKKIGKFQAIQHSLARLAGEVAAAVSAAGSAADTLSGGQVAGDALLLEVAAAKIRCGEAAEVGAAIAHQVHGAIGFTSEHILHRFTLRAQSWRDDFGPESHWAVELGRRIAARGADDLWPLVASR
jgi:acyl-CoA dehydrogenase